jgi:hypothetical protein
MFHSNTEQLIDYWRSRKGSDKTPARKAVNPADFAGLLPQVIMLGRLSPGQYRVRLAGGFITDLHGRELREDDFMRLWEPGARTPLQLALEAGRRHPEPLVVEAEACAGEASMRMEIMLAPLRGPSGEVDRLIGLYQPLTPAAALMGGVVRALRLKSVTAAGAADDPFPRLRLAALDGRRIA